MYNADKDLYLLHILKSWTYARGIPHFQMLIKVNMENKNDQISSLPSTNRCYIPSTN